MAVEAASGVPEHAEGMPQLDFSTFPNQIFWLIVTLVIIYLVLNRIAVPRISGILSERNRTIESDIELSERYSAKAVALEEAYEATLHDARKQAREIAAETKAAILEDLEVAIAEADARVAVKIAESERRIQEIRDNAVRSVEFVATEVAGEIVRTVMPGTEDPNAVRAAVANRLIN